MLNESVMSLYLGGVDGLGDVVGRGDLAKGLPILEGIAVLKNIHHINMTRPPWLYSRTDLKHPEKKTPCLLKVLLDVFQHKRKVKVSMACTGLGGKRQHCAMLLFAAAFLGCQSRKRPPTTKEKKGRNLKGSMVRKWLQNQARLPRHVRRIP
jgi:hypothetical protein